MGVTEQGRCSHGLRAAGIVDNAETRRLEQFEVTKAEPPTPGFLGVCMNDPLGRRLGLFLFLLVGFFFLELIYGMITGSVALLSDALHMLSDVMAIAMAIHAISVSKRPEDATYTYGMTRASVVAGLVNGVFLISVTGMMLFEVAGKFIHIEELKSVDGRGKEILWVGSAGLAVNLLGLCLVGEAGHSHGPGEHGHGHGGGDDHAHGEVQGHGQGHKHGHGHGHGHGDGKGKSHGHGGNDHGSSTMQTSVETEDAHASVEKHGNLNVDAAFLHVLGDTLGSVCVVAVALILMYAEGDWKYFADPVLTLIILTIIAKSAVPLMYKCIAILMQGTPGDIDIAELRWEVAQASPEILNIHDLHIWTLEPGRVVGSMHVVLPSESNFTQILAVIKDTLHARGIHSCTVQPEYHAPEAQLPSRLPWRSTVQSEGCADTVCLMPCAIGCRDEKVCCNERRKKPSAPRSQRYGNAFP